MKTIKNYLFNLAYQITAIIVPFVTTPYISRVFGPDGVGSYSVSYAIAQYFCLFGMLGLNTYGTREIAYCRNDERRCCETFWNLNYTRFITMGASIILYVFYLYFGVDSHKKALYLSQIPVLLAYFLDISWYFAGIEEFKATAIRNIIVKVCGMVLVFLCVKRKYDVWIYALIISVSLFGGQIVLWGKVLKQLKICKPKKKLIIHFLKSTVKLWIPAVAINVYTSLDKVMLGYIANDTEAGLYENSQKMIKIISTITTTFAAVMSPKMSNYYANLQLHSIRDNVYKSFRFVTFLAIPMVFGIIAIKDTFVPWFFGVDFDQVSNLLTVSAWLVLSLSWSNVLGYQVLIACGKEKQFTIAVTAGAFVNIILNSFLIPKFGSLGATVASVLAEFTGMILMVFFSRDFVSYRLLFKGIHTYFLSGIVMGVLCYVIGMVIGKNVLSTLIQTTTGVGVYYLMMYILKDEMIINATKVFHNYVCEEDIK